MGRRRQPAFVFAAWVLMRQRGEAAQFNAPTFVAPRHKNGSAFLLYLFFFYFFFVFLRLTLILLEGISLNYFCTHKSRRPPHMHGMASVRNKIKLIAFLHCLRILVPL